tara:strand:- start:212 stop:412 length:201 start_codon:yes stop_codon:yes gene_type:complete
LVPLEIQRDDGALWYSTSATSATRSNGNLKKTIGDKLHYCKEAQIEIGKRFAAAYLKLSTATDKEK